MMKSNNNGSNIREWAGQVRINSSRVYLEQFVRQAAASLPPGSAVLDAGAGDAPYKPLFDHVHYESADFCQVEGAPYDQVTYVCDLASIPVEDQRYDLVLCTQVLEHLPEPLAVLRELHRVLKDGGELWLSAPLFYPEHQIPFDYFRYTQFGLGHLLSEAGFQVRKIEPLEGYYGTLAFQMEIAALALPVSSRRFGGGAAGALAAALSILLKPVLFLLSLFFSRLDLRHKNTQIGHPKNFTAVAWKEGRVENEE